MQVDYSWAESLVCRRLQTVDLFKDVDRCSFHIGLAGGAASASRSVSKDPESRKRIETAFRRFRADVLRKEADELDKGSSVWDKMF